MASSGNSSRKDANVKLTTTLYTELRKLAAARMARQENPITLQATALVHEAWIKLGANEQPDWENRAHFFSSMATVMHDILVDRARRRQRIRHGGHLKRVELDLDDKIQGAAFSSESDDLLLALHEALDKLKALDDESGELINLRYFGGMSVKELAEHQQLSVRTTERRLRYARAWLERELTRDKAA